MDGGVLIKSFVIAAESLTGLTPFLGPTSSLLLFFLGVCNQEPAIKAQGASSFERLPDRNDLTYARY